MRAVLLATTALSLLPAAAFADGGKLFSGLGDVGYDHVDLDFGGSDGLNQFHGTGSALWTFSDNLNVQGNFDFNSFDTDGGEGISTSRFGGGVFWRDPNDYAIGGELHYQRLEGLDGINLRARGEMYLSEATLGAFVGFSSYDDIDGFQLGGYGSYYLEPQIALNGTLRYSTWDGAFGSSDVDDLSLSGEVEYLIPDCDTSIYGGLGFGSFDSDSNDEGYWHIGAGLRVHFGPDGSLQQRNRAEPLRTIRDHFIF